MSGGNYQILMSKALRQFAQDLTLADVVSETIFGRNYIRLE